jgi:hypothetical protein
MQLITRSKIAGVLIKFNKWGYSINCRMGSSDCFKRHAHSCNSYTISGLGRNYKVVPTPTSLFT